MFKDQKDIPLVSKPLGNVDDCNPVQWLYKHYPGIFHKQRKIKDIKASIEQDMDHFLISIYKLSQTGEKYLKVRIHWKLAVDEEQVELYSTLYSTIKCPEDPENLREVAKAKAKVLMVAETYCQTLVASLDQTHEKHELIEPYLGKFKIMTEFTVESTSTGRIKNFTITTKEKDSGNLSNKFEVHKIATPYFAVSTINQYESLSLIFDEGPDKLYTVVSEEKIGKVNRFLIDYYTLCSNRYCQTFEEAYSRFIDVVAEDEVQNYIHELRDMEAGAQSQIYSVDEIRNKFDRVIKFVKQHHESSRYEYEIMKDSFSHLEEVIDKFDSWREHPDLSMAQTSLLEGKITELSKIVNSRRILLTELRRRFEKIEYWASWFKKQFPTLFLMLDD